jgi:hypothetical protein
MPSAGSSFAASPSGDARFRGPRALTGSHSPYLRFGPSVGCAISCFHAQRELPFRTSQGCVFSMAPAEMVALSFRPEDANARGAQRTGNLRVYSPVHVWERYQHRKERALDRRMASRLRAASLVLSGMSPLRFFNRCRKMLALSSSRRGGCEIAEVWMGAARDQGSRTSGVIK